MVRRRAFGSRFGAVLLAWVALSGNASAQDQGEILGAEDEPAEGDLLTFHGFVSQGFLWSTANNYLAQTDRGSFEFFEAALNLSRPFTNRLRMAAQLFTRDLGPLGDYRIAFDWAFLDYRHDDWLGLRAGRYKIPFGLYNEFSDYDPGRLQILLPQSIYPITFREFLLAATGAELYGYLLLGSAGALEYHLYGGTIFIEPREIGVPLESRLDVPYTLGGRVLWETPAEGLTLGASLLGVRLDANIELAGTPVGIRVPAVLWVASAEYVRHRLVVAAEYSRWQLDLQSTDETVVPSALTVSERFYLLSAYRISDLLQAGLYYSGLFPDVSDRSGRESYQHDLAATVRFDLTPNWLLKIEGHFLRGTAALSPALNDGIPRSDLTMNWGLLLAKTTVFF